MKALLVVSFLAAALALRAEKGERPWPAAAWPRSTPAAQGMDAAPLEALHAELADGRHGYVDSMLVVRNGHLVFERTYPHDYAALFEGKDPKRGPYNYYDPDWHPYYQKTDLHTLQSASKSITSVLVGIARKRGELPGLDVEVRRYLTGFRTSPDPRQARITLRHLLTMTSGIRWDETTVAYTDPANSCARMEASPDWVQFVLDQPMAEEPGRTFVYNSGVTQLIAQVLARATGKNPADYAVEHLFEPLGIERFYWKRTPTGLPDAEGGLYLAAPDLARLGYLFLNDGVWKGRRLLPEGWVAASTQPHVETTPGIGWPPRYGYQWWVVPDAAGARYPAYTMSGYGGQRLIVVPERALVAVFTGWNIYDKPGPSWRLLLDRLMASAAPQGRP